MISCASGSAAAVPSPITKAWPPRWTPEEVALTNLQLDKAIALLDEMPLIYRQTLVLRVKGYSIREIAKITDSSESNVKTRIHRARAMLLKSFVEQAE